MFVRSKMPAFRWEEVRPRSLFLYGTWERPFISCVARRWRLFRYVRCGEFASIVYFRYDRRMAQYSGIKSALDSSENFRLAIKSISSMLFIHWSDECGIKGVQKCLLCSPPQRSNRCTFLQNYLEMGRRRPTVKYEHLLRFIDRSHLIDQLQFVATEDSNRLEFTCQLGYDSHWAKVCAVSLGASAGSQLVSHSPQCIGATNHVMLRKGASGYSLFQLSVANDGRLLHNASYSLASLSELMWRLW